jgi:hypothetical protein
VSDRAELEARAHEVRERADALAAPIAAAARERTTLSCERAVLRLFGVSGIDRQGRPLAHEVVERLVALGPARVAGGVALPFAAAALEYDLPPQELALEIASGHIDLGLEAELLREPDKRVDAEAAVEGWLSAAWQRFDANRTARAELRGMLGDRRLTWIGVELAPGAAGEAAEAAARMVEQGIDLVCVRVPRDRELLRGLGEELEPSEGKDEPALAPAGSQRGLGHLRAALDEDAAERGRYARLATRAVGLAAPDQAVVAGFERVDVCFTDPLRAVVELGVDPDRAFADHLFALQLHARSGAQIVLGAGPLAVAPELSRGEPIAPHTRAGRALALQALGLALTRLALPEDRILLGAMPPDALADPRELRHGLAEIAIRRLAFPDLPLAIEEPESAEAATGWSQALVAWLAPGPAPALVVCRPTRSFGSTQISGLRMATEAARWLGDGRQLGFLRGEPLEYASEALDVAVTTLRGLGSDGWEPLLDGGAPRQRPDAASTSDRIGAAGVYPKRDHRDPFASRPIHPVAGGASR